jgi:hypothetical protein
VGRKAEERAAAEASRLDLPVVLVWLPDFVPHDWHLVTLRKGCEDVLFTAKAGGVGIWELQPRARLEEGAYCLVEGDPVLARLDSSDQAFYCFGVGY